MGFKGTDSCYAAAKDDEPMFVLLGRDLWAPDLVERWCDARVWGGKNCPGDDQIIEARELAQKMRDYREKLHSGKAVDEASNT